MNHSTYYSIKLYIEPIAKDYFCVRPCKATFYIREDGPLKSCHVELSLMYCINLGETVSAIIHYCINH